MRSLFYIGYGLLGLFIVLNLHGYMTASSLLSGGAVGQQLQQIKHLLWILFLFYVGMKAQSFE